MQSATPARHVFDPLLRLIHAWNALAIIGLVVTLQVAEALEHDGNEALAWSVHVQFGYALIGGLTARLVWGLVGPASARWSDLWHPREWAAMLRGHFSTAPREGHDARASLAFLGLYAVLLLMSLTGLGLAGIEHDMGPLSGLPNPDALEELFEEPHEFGFALVLGFLILHLGALAFHRFVLLAPVGQSMVTGRFKRRHDEHDATVPGAAGRSRHPD